MSHNVHTVLGNIPSDQLGTVLMHEHICSADWSMRMNFGARFCDEERVLARAVEHVNRAKKAGVSTIVDGTAVNLGRDIHLLRKVSRITGVNIIASSGFYAQDEPWLEDQHTDYLQDLLDYECKHGIAGTDSLPGIMKCAVGPEGITHTREKLLRLTARVAVENDLPLFCHHAAKKKGGREIVELLTSEGLNPARIIMGHAGDSDDPDYTESLLAMGCYVGDDRGAYDERFGAVETRIKNLTTLYQRGWKDKILLSNDLCVYLGFWEPMEATLANSSLYEEEDYTFLFKKLMPKLVEAGIPQEVLTQMVTENPRSFFTW